MPWKGLQERLAGGFGGFGAFEAGKRQLNAFKTDGWERLVGGFGWFGAFEGGQMAGLKAVKNRWLGHVAARVVASCLGKACGRV